MTAAIIITALMALVGGILLAVGIIQMERDNPEYKGEDFLND